MTGVNSHPQRSFSKSRTASSRQLDVLVIGGGIVGAAAALAMAKRARRVALVERSSISVASGSSAGRSRIYCPAAYPDESYLELGLMALTRWRQLEDASGQRLLCPTGALTRGAFAEQEMPALREAGVEADFVSAADAISRFGVRVSDERPMIHQTDAGVIRADHARNVLLRMAAAEGVELRGNERVRSIEEDGDSLEVDTDRGRWRCSSAIVAAGPWSAELLAGVGIDLPVNVSRQSVTYFDVAHSSEKPTAVMEFEGDEPFACWDPLHGLKAALHAQGPKADLEAATPRIDHGAIEKVVSWVEARYPGLAARLAGVEPCLYSNTPDESFTIERVGRVVVGCACNGQGFQFAPETGERLARLAAESADLSATQV